MDILQDLFTMPQEAISGSLLPPGINLESLDPDEEAENTTTMEHKESHLPLFGLNKQMVDHNMNDSPHKVALGTGARNLMVRLGSQGSLPPESDTDLDISQSEFEHAKMSSKDSTEIRNSSLVFTSADMLEPRCTTPDESLAVTQLPNTVQDLDKKLNPVTPTKPDDTENQDPWTPTANLKVLMSAASPEIRNRDRQKEINKNMKDITYSLESNSTDTPMELVESVPNVAKTKGKKSKGKKTKEPEDQVLDEECETDLEIDCSQTQGPSRKDKSLGLLCQRFLSMFPKYPGPFDNIEICLDEVAKNLSVERRRIYDIVNVLESVEIVSRQAKNKYIWHGKTNLQHTLAKLQTLAKMEGFVEQFEKIRDFEVSRESDSETSKKDNLSKQSPASRDKSGHNKAEVCKAGCTNFLRDNLKKDKSLGIMSQRFIMLFLISKPKTVNLDLSAKILVGDPNIDRTENAKFKTKIRRLYDIANILTSLELIKKVHVTEVRGRKPAFKYIGPDIDSVEQIATCSHDGAHRPSSKHSLLDCIQNPQVCTMLNAHKSFKPTSTKNSLLSASSSHSDGSLPPRLAKKSFSRHSSLDQICEVAELERTRLYFESSRSQPSSPNKFLPTSNDPRPMKTVTNTPVNPPSNKTQKILPQDTRGNGTQASVQKNDHSDESGVVKNVTIPELGKTVILKAVGANTGVLSVTENQLREIIKSLGTKAVNINTASDVNHSSHLVDAATQSSPEPLQSLSKMKEEPNLLKKRKLPPGLKIVRVSRPVTSSVSESIQTDPERKEGVPPSIRVKRSLEEGFKQAQELEPRSKRVKQEDSYHREQMSSNKGQVTQQVDSSSLPNLEENLKAEDSFTAAVQSDNVTVTPEVTSPDTVPVIEKDIPHDKVIVQDSKVSAMTTVSQPVSFATPVLPAPHSLNAVTLQTNPVACQMKNEPLVQLQTKSQPNTPSFCLQTSSSPVMLVPARPASLEGLPQMVGTPPSLSTDPKLVIPQPKLLATKQGTAYRTLVSPMGAGIGPIPGTMVFGPANISPLQQFPESLMTPTSHNAMLTAAGASPLFENFQVTSTPTQMMRPPGGYPPSSSNIINLAPFFNSPTGKEQEATRAVITDPTKHIGRIISATPHIVSQSQQFISMVGGAQQGNQANPNNLLSPVTTLLTPKTVVNPITVNGKPVSTPGCFFRSTPGGLQQVGFQGQKSAFQVVNRLTIQNGEGPISTARRLQLSGEETKSTIF